jgi:molecular chaperone Hsp33
MEVNGKDPVSWISQYYEQSEQRPARAFRLDDENFVLIAAQPDCDLEWLAGLDEDAVANIEQTEEPFPLRMHTRQNLANPRKLAGATG